MTLAEILATKQKIAYVDNVGGATKEFHDVIMTAVCANSTELPDEIADLFVLSYVDIGNEHRALVNWA